MTTSPIFTFNESLSLIETGDILFLKKSRNPSAFARMISRVVKAASRGDFYHVGFLVKVKVGELPEQLYVVEANTGERRFIPFSVYDGYKMSIIEKPINPNIYLSALMRGVGKEKYSNLDAVTIGIKEYFGVESYHRDFDGEVCSELTSKLLNLGLEEPIAPTLISPTKLFDELVNRGYKVKFNIGD
jgi:hypothetical protein